MTTTDRKQAARLRRQQRRQQLQPRHEHVLARVVEYTCGECGKLLLRREHAPHATTLNPQEGRA